MRLTEQLDSFDACSLPLPVQRRQFQLPVPGIRGMYRVEIFDLEDDDLPSPEAEPPQRQRALTR